MVRVRSQHTQDRRIVWLSLSAWLSSPPALACLLLTASLAGAEPVAELLAIRDRLRAERGASAADLASGSDLRYELDLVGVIAPRGPADLSNRQDLALVLEHVQGRWRTATGRSPSYNKAEHLGDATRLIRDGGRLHGTVVLRIHADGWVPADGKPRTITVALDARSTAEDVAGRWSCEGDLGAYAGDVRGRSIDLPPPPPESSLTWFDGAGDSGTAATRLYQEIRALLLARAGNGLVDLATALSASRIGEATWDDPGAGRRHAERLLDLVQNALAAPLPTLLEPQTTTDPDFAPLADIPMEVDAGGRCLLPADAGAAGPPRWRHVSRWRLLAAAAQDPTWDRVLPILPDVLPDPMATWAPNQAALGAGYKPPQPGPQRWQDCTNPGLRYITPPGQAYYPRLPEKKPGKIDGVHGVLAARWYATTTLVAAADCDVWISLLADDQGQLWHDERLLWRGNARQAQLLRLRLHGGENRLLLVCQNLMDTSAIALSVCVSGGPRAKGHQEQVLAATRTATAALPPSPVRGRLGDGTSSYPGAQPPMGWDLRTGMNVVWRQELPSYSGANPVLTDDAVLVNCEPHRLYCFDKSTGKERWHADSHVFEFVPEADRAAALRSWEEVAASAEDPQMLALDADKARFAAKLDALQDQGNGDKPEALAVQAELDRVAAERKGFLDRIGAVKQRWCAKLGVENPGWSNNIGNTFGAPVTDGERVWVKYGTGVAACYDLSGKRHWLVHTRLSGGECGNLSSPILAGGNLIIAGVRGRERGKPIDPAAPGWPPFYRHWLVAYRADTGELAWERPIWMTGGYGGPTGLALLRLADGSQQRDCVVTGSGLLIDPATGRLLSDCLGVDPSGNLWAGDPLLIGNRGYFRRGGRINIFEFWLDGDEIRHRHVLSTAKSSAANQPGCVWHGGRLYGNTGKGSANRQPVPWHELGVVDATDGTLVTEIFPALRNGGLAYTPPAVAGDTVVICGTGPGPAAWSIPARASAEIGFISTGPVPNLLATCAVQDEAMTAAPAFEGDRMYLRTYRSVTCIGVTTPEGATYALRNQARTVIESLPTRPVAAEVLSIVHPAHWTPAPGLAAEPLREMSAPQAWLVAGPVPRAVHADPLPEIPTGPDCGLGTSLTLCGQPVVWSALASDFLQVNKGWIEDHMGLRHWRASSTIRLLAAAGRTPDSATAFASAISTDHDRVVRVNLSAGQGLRIWVGGRQVLSGQLMLLPTGRHLVVALSEVGKVPAFLKENAFGLSFTEVPDPQQALQAWRSTLAPRRAQLVELLDRLPACEERLRLLEVLEHLPESP